MNLDFIVGTVDHLYTERGGESESLSFSPTRLNVSLRVCALSTPWAASATRGVVALRGAVTAGRLYSTVPLFFFLPLLPSSFNLRSTKKAPARLRHALSDMIAIPCLVLTGSLVETQRNCSKSSKRDLTT